MATIKAIDWLPLNIPNIIACSRIFCSQQQFKSRWEPFFIGNSTQQTHCKDEFAVQCNSLRHTATHYKILHHCTTQIKINELQSVGFITQLVDTCWCSSLRHRAPYSNLVCCSMFQYVAASCSKFLLCCSIRRTAPFAFGQRRPTLYILWGDLTLRRHPIPYRTLCATFGIFDVKSQFYFGQKTAYFLQVSLRNRQEATRALGATRT